MFLVVAKRTIPVLPEFLNTTFSAINFASNSHTGHLKEISGRLTCSFDLSSPVVICELPASESTEL